MGMALEVDYIVDLSNVCRSTDLGAPTAGASLKCLKRLEKAIVKFLKGRAPVLTYVADNNLWRLLEQSDGVNFVGDWKRRKAKVLFEAEVADGIILKMASTSGTKVITGDTFRDHRRDHPWLQNNSEDFYGWKRQDDEVVLVQRTLEALSESEISRYSELKHLKTAKLDQSSRPDQNILESLYRCENLKCQLRSLSPSYLPIHPNKNRKNPNILECPSCKTKVLEIGFVGRVAQLKFKILETGAEGRITFKVDSNVVIGQQEILRALPEATKEDTAACADVSSKHLKILVSSGGVQVADNGSTNGTQIARPTQEGFYSSPVTLTDIMVGLNHGDRLYLGGAVELKRSGRRFGFANLTVSQSDEAVRRTHVREP
jgi:hypothetical protein